MTCIMDTIHKVIDRSTTASIASAGLWGHIIAYNREAPMKFSQAEREKFNKFTRLFLPRDSPKRLEMMRTWFPLEGAPGAIDVPALHEWLKEVAEIMKWEDVREVREILGVSLSEDVSIKEADNEHWMRDNVPEKRPKVKSRIDPIDWIVVSESGEDKDKSDGSPSRCRVQ